MASYPPPLSYVPIYNALKFEFDPLTQVSANKLYIRKTGADVAVGPLTLSNKLILPNGTVSLPSLTFSNSSTAGLYLIGTNSIGFATNGINRLTIDNSNITSSNPIRATVFQSTTLGGPSAVYSNSISTQTGMYFPTSTTVGFVQNGSYTLTLASGQIIPFNPIRAQNGSAVVPSYSFSNSADSGLFLLAPNYVGMSVGTDTIQTWEGKFCKFWGNDTGNNTGYTPSAFGHYEEYSGSGTWDWGNANATITYRLTRIGRIVHLQLLDSVAFGNAVVATNAVTLRLANAIPTRFRPIHDMSNVGVTVCFDGILANYMYYFISAQANGQIAINRGSTVASTIAVTTYRCTATWTV